MTAFKIINDIDIFLQETNGTAFVAFINFGKQNGVLSKESIYEKIRSMDLGKKIRSDEVNRLSADNVKILNTEHISEDILVQIMGRAYDSVLMVVNEFQFVSLRCIEKELKSCQSGI